MARREDTTPETITKARIRWLEAQQRKLSVERKEAGEAGSWSAVAALAREIRTCRDQADTERLRQAQAPAKQTRTAADYTAEEWANLVAEDAAQATEEDLEVYMAEWLRRKKYQIEPGSLRLVRRTG